MGKEGLMVTEHFPDGKAFGVRVSLRERPTAEAPRTPRFLV